MLRPVWRNEPQRCPPYFSGLLYPLWMTSRVGERRIWYCYLKENMLETDCGKPESPRGRRESSSEGKDTSHLLGLEDPALWEGLCLLCLVPLRGPRVGVSIILFVDWAPGTWVSPKLSSSLKTGCRPSQDGPKNPCSSPLFYWPRSYMDRFLPWKSLLGTNAPS